MPADIPARQKSPADPGWMMRRWSLERLESLPGLGIGLCLVTVLLYQVMDVIVKTGTVHPFILLLWRDCILTPQYVPSLIHNKLNPFPRDKMWLLALRGLADGVNLMMQFYALKVLPLGDVTMMSCIKVAFVNLFSCIFLKEPCGIPEIISILLVFGGVTLVVQPPFLFGSAGDSGYTDEMLIVALAFLASCAVASLAIVVVRHLRDVHWSVLGVNARIFNILEVLAILAYSGHFCFPSCGWERLSIVLLSFIALVGGNTFVWAIKYEKASVIGLMDNATHLLVSQVFSILFFAEYPSPLKVLGVLLTLSAVVGVGGKRLAEEIRGSRKREHSDEV